MLNWLVKYYNAWVAKGIEYAAMEGYHIGADGVIIYTQVNGVVVAVYSVFGFWFVHVGLLVFIFCLLYLIKKLPRYFGERRQKNVESPH